MPDRDPVEERMGEMAEAMVRWDTWEQDIDLEIRTQYVERGGRLLKAAGVPALLAERDDLQAQLDNLRQLATGMVTTGGDQLGENEQQRDELERLRGALETAADPQEPELRSIAAKLGIDPPHVGGHRAE